jgi:hypothetical protein
MKVFSDLEFKNHPAGEEFGVTARIQFDNGYGISVVKGPSTYGGDIGLYEAAVLDSNGQLCYDTPITDDVVGYLRDKDVTDIMIEIQKLPKKDTDERYNEDGYFA